MAADPYFDVKAEVEATLQTLSTLHSSYHRILRSLPPSHHPGSEELSWSLSELKATLSAIEGDVDELEDSVLAVEEPGVAARLGIKDHQVRERRAFVERVKRELAVSTHGLSKVLKDMARRRASLQPSSSYPLSEDQEDDRDQTYEMQHQTLLIEQQDRTLTDISGTVGMLREQAKVMGHEVYEQNIMLDELDQHVDSTANRLDRAQRRMNKFIKDNQSSPSSWLVFVLIIILSVLLFIIVFV